MIDTRVVDLPDGREDVARVFAACPDRVMPSASRSLLVRGPDGNRLRDTVAALAAEFRHLLPGRRAERPGGQSDVATGGVDS
jgi:hypothetical protein